MFNYIMSNNYTYKNNNATAVDADSDDLFSFVLEREQLSARTSEPSAKPHCEPFNGINKKSSCSFRKMLIIIALIIIIIGICYHLSRYSSSCRPKNGIDSKEIAMIMMSPDIGHDFRAVFAR